MSTRVEQRAEPVVADNGWGTRDEWTLQERSVTGVDDRASRRAPITHSSPGTTGLADSGMKATTATCTVQLGSIYKNNSYLHKLLSFLALPWVSAGSYPKASIQA